VPRLAGSLPALKRYSVVTKATGERNLRPHRERTAINKRRGRMALLA
jgi:hypothetical protein